MKAFKSPLTMAFIVICLAIIPQLPVTSAHPPQIEEACTKYNTMSVNGKQSCVSILSAIPDCDKTDDLATMALTGMEFAELKVSETAQTIKNRLKDKSLQARAYGPLKTCMHLYNEGSYSFGFGLLAFKEQNYDMVNYRWLNAAQQDVDRCERELNKVGVKGEDVGIKTNYMLEVSNSAQAAFQYFTNKLSVATNKNHF